MGTGRYYENRVDRGEEKDDTKISGFCNCGAIGLTNLQLRDLGRDIDSSSLVSYILATCGY